MREKKVFDMGKAMEDNTPLFTDNQYRQLQAAVMAGEESYTQKLKEEFLASNVEQADRLAEEKARRYDPAIEAEKMIESEIGKVRFEAIDVASARLYDLQRQLHELQELRVKREMYRTNPIFIVKPKRGADADLVREFPQRQAELDL